MVDNFKLIIKQLILNIKTIGSNKSNFLIIGFIIIIAVSLPIVFTPFFASAGMVIVICILPTSAVFYSSINYNFRHSSLKNNMSLTKNNKWLFYISTLLTMIICSSIVDQVMYLILLIVNNNNLLLLSWLKRVEFVEGGYVYKFSLQLNLMFLYCAVLTTAMTFAISFIFQYWANDRKTYFILIMILTILTIVFGGALNQYWATGAGGARRLSDDVILYKWKDYWFSAIFPYFSMGSLGSAAAGASKMKVGLETSYSQLELLGSNGFFSVTESGYAHKTLFGFFRLDNDPLWLLLMATPYIEIIIFFFIGTLISKYKKT